MKNEVAVFDDVGRQIEVQVSPGEEIVWLSQE